MTGQPISRVGDKTSHGGKIITGSPTREIGGRAVARIGDSCTCPTHGKTKIVKVSGKRPQTDGKQTAHVGATTACGAKLLPSQADNVEGTTE